MNPGRCCRGGREWPGFGGAGSQEDGRSLSRLSTVRAMGENLSIVLDDGAGWGLGAGAGAAHLLQSVVLTLEPSSWNPEVDMQANW